MRNIIQIAGVRNRAEANGLVEAGVDFIGFPLRLGFHQEDLSEEAARDLIGRIKKLVEPVLITYLQKAHQIQAFCKYLGVGTVQLHERIAVEELRRLKESLPSLKVIKSLIIRENNVKELEQEIRIFSPYTEMFITDTYDPKTGATGATGQTHDWEVSQELVRISEKPVMLAGGLTPGNVADAIRIVRPAGVDAHTGVENERGEKDFSRVRRFVGNAKLAYAEMGG